MSICHDDNRLVANIAKKEVLVGNELEKVHTLHNTFRLYRESSLDMQSTLSIEKKMLCNFKNSINEVELKLLFAKSKYFFCNIVINHGEHGLYLHVKKPVYVLTVFQVSLFMLVVKGMCTCFHWSQH